MATSDLPAAFSVPAPTQTTNAPRPGQPQRQSCDRCHKKKLRCTREHNNSGGVCDRCLSKRAQCVYSIGLPKGRPSLHRRMTDEPSSQNAEADTTNVPPGTRRRGRESSTSSPSKSVHDVAYAQPILNQAPTFTGPTSAPAIMPPVVPPLDMSLWTRPWLESNSTEGMPSTMSWGMNFSRPNLDDMLVATAGLENDSNVHEIQEMFSPQHSLSSQDSTHAHPITHGQAGPLNHERQAMSAHRSDGSRNMIPDKNTGVVLAQLSELSVQLSSLRASSQALAQGTDFSSSQSQDCQNLSLIDSATFDAVATWLSQGSISVRHQPRSQNNQSLLRDVFSASHRFIEIIQHLQADEIVRHLVLACEALMLEIYLAVLTTLEREAYWIDSGSTTPLGNIRLVLVVQLCAYLIERQQQGVNQCLSPGQKHYVVDSMPFQVDSVNGDYLKNAKREVQKKLTQVRQLLGCS